MGWGLGGGGGGGILTMCQNTTMRLYGAWNKIYYVLCPKTYIYINVYIACYNPPLVCDKPLGAPAFVNLFYFSELWCVSE